MEEWKDIPGYEGLYEVSNIGRVRTAEGKTTSSARFKHRVWKQRIMKLKYEARKSGRTKDARVCLWKDGKEKTLLVSRLVAMAWCAGYEDGKTVNHIDGDPMNNHAENLEWISLADNIRHGFANGMYPKRPCVLVKETGEQIRFSSLSEASLSIGRSKSYVGNCIIRNAPVKSINGDVYGLI